MSVATVNGQAPPAAAIDDAAARTFADLEAQARALEAPAAPPGGEPGQVAPAGPDNAAELLQALEMARGMVRPMFRWWPDFADTWNDDTLKAIADGGGQVMTKHGWTMGGLFSEFAPYIALGTATVPPVMVTLAAIKARKAELANGPPAPIDASGPSDPPNQ